MKRGFTLIELLISLSIIAIILALSTFGLTNARQASRDAKRKTDLETIRSGLELYKADCNSYPSKTAGDITVRIGTSLVGNDSTTACSAQNTYISQMPDDPIPANYYEYFSNGITYRLCATQETGGTVSGCTTACGGSGSTCNYKVVNP